MYKQYINVYQTPNGRRYQSVIPFHSRQIANDISKETCAINGNKRLYMIVATPKARIK